MSGRAARTEVLIVGAGPTGLFLAGLLALRGVDVAVLERRPRPVEHSRAIGLHPPALHALDRLGLAAPAVAAGVCVGRGVGYAGGPGPGGVLGELSLAAADPAYPFVLTLPQVRTEALLAERVEWLAPGAVHRGVEVIGVEQTGVVTGPEGRVWEAAVVVGADGTRSRVRELAGLGVRERDWGDCYLMGDFDDTGDTGDAGHAGAAGDAGAAEPAAHLHLHRDGVVERFPLPGGRWRWVVHTGRTLVPETAEGIAERARERIGLAPDPATATMLSAFRVQRRLATGLVRGRTVLAGDAAHGISPIGGQGMTLGWMDAIALEPLLLELLRGGARPGPAGGGSGLAAGDRTGGALERHPGFARYDRGRRRAALRAARQAEANMLLGRPMPAAAWRARDAVARAALAGGAGSALTRLYTMGWAG
ncbi:FAD-dependent monooxygenase [Citricoccus sp. SGAir0253]|uniref:FAD-dependent oxidoreductase n=1 Tax=Citricoccus sp. SGAir0253 TaxID=2567881 RepID=UPI0010CCE0F4|nr:NAD(P)/FAD-dependent oxidoreductase [Citricoccus sp. SGAir0253]QCU77525.1 FAD-dependent monooxygenase [Citricoccus sp. SGAir0253]